MTRDSGFSTLLSLASLDAADYAFLPGTVTIPAGETITYAELARRIGRPTAVRAVGLANGSNPVAVIVPCHRVVGSDGALTGYGGGLWRKRWLLDHEAGKAAGARA